jgi:catechol-2,3-dioxygenase
VLGSDAIRGLSLANAFGDIDLRVTSMDEALPFYEALLPAPGFRQRHHGQVWKDAVFFADPCGNRFEVYFRQAG